MHAAGYLETIDGSLIYRGSKGRYWSSTHYSTPYGFYMELDIDHSYMNGHEKANGYPLRCLRE